MNSGYKILLRYGRFFIGKDTGNTGKYFLGQALSRFYVALYWDDLNPFVRKKTKTMFWKYLFRGEK